MKNIPENVSELVYSRYSEIAIEMMNTDSGSCCSTDCCKDTTDTEATGIERAPLSLGCDLRLIDTAAPQPGEIVLDLGSGSGYDARTMADLVGDEGQIIGIDFGEEMIKLARRKSQEYSNITYIRSDIQDIPLKDNFADLIVSNCVFNLVENKSQVFAEVFRLLKPGGRMVVSDMITINPETEITGEDYCACIGGATSIEEYTSTMRNTGFVDIETIKEYDNSYKTREKDIDYQSVLFTGYKK